METFIQEKYESILPFNPEEAIQSVKVFLYIIISVSTLTTNLEAF